MTAIVDNAAVQAGPAVELHTAVQPAAPFDGHRNDLNAPIRALSTS